MEARHSGDTVGLEAHGINSSKPTWASSSELLSFLLPGKPPQLSSLGPPPSSSLELQGFGGWGVGGGHVRGSRGAVLVGEPSQDSAGLGKSSVQNHPTQHPARGGRARRTALGEEGEKERTICFPSKS